MSNSPTPIFLVLRQEFLVIPLSLKNPLMMRSMERLMMEQMPWPLRH